MISLTNSIRTLDALDAVRDPAKLDGYIIRDILKYPMIDTLEPQPRNVERWVEYIPPTSRQLSRFMLWQLSDPEEDEGDALPSCQVFTPSRNMNDVWTVVVAMNRKGFSHTTCGSYVGFFNSPNNPPKTLFWRNAAMLSTSEGLCRAALMAHYGLSASSNLEVKLTISDLPAVVPGTNTSTFSGAINAPARPALRDTTSNNTLTSPAARASRPRPATRADSPSMSASRVSLEREIAGRNFDAGAMAGAAFVAEMARQGAATNARENLSPVARSERRSAVHRAQQIEGRRLDGVIVDEAATPLPIVTGSSLSAIASAFTSMLRSGRPPSGISAIDMAAVQDEMRGYVRETPDSERRDDDAAIRRLSQMIQNEQFPSLGRGNSPSDAGIGG